MKIGVVFPQTEIGSDPALITEYATRAEALGFDHIIAFDHVLGVNTASRPDWRGPYTSQSVFHEPFVLYSYLAGQTNTIEFVTAVIILPQRQTALVAKQAACLDVLSGGRLRLGIGTGWNDVEYEALGENFHNRGKRSEEQIDLMRKLWADEHVTYDGRWHKVTDAGINPRPQARRIPVWFGGMAPQVLERVGTMGDGWFPLGGRSANLEGMWSQIREHAEAAGRDVQEIGLEIMSPGRDVAENMDRARSLGATHYAVNTMGAGLTGRAHIERIEELWGDIEKVR
ncbi:MAG: LLM class F420-dependent oxidoreductase [Pseudomonadales bacterium]